MRREVSGWATVTCVTRPNGHLKDCVVESEFPAGSHFGEATVKSLRPAVIGRSDNSNGPVPVGRVSLRTSFAVAFGCASVAPGGEFHRR